MRSRIAAVLLALLLCSAAAAQSTTAPATTQATDASIHVDTDRDEAIYKSGEPIAFRASFVEHGKPVAGRILQYRLTRDGVAELSSGTITTGDGPVEIESSLDEPGFVRCELTYDGNGAPITAIAAAGVDPQEIKPSLPPPVDFERYWKRQRALLTDHPAEPVLTPVESSDPSILVFDVTVDVPGVAPLSGYLALPKDAAAKTLPAILYPHSAGVRSSNLARAVHFARLGAICFDFNAHGLPNGQPEAFYENLRQTTLKGYSTLHADDLEKIYLRGIVLRLLRAIEFTTARAEWDGKTLIAAGESQGGGQALMAAGLEPRVSLCIASVPALCDHTGFAANRASGWPRIVKLDEKGKPVDASAEIVRYFDAMNFVALIKCRTLVTVGFIDGVCPPTSVYAAYNAIPAENKQIINRPRMGHKLPPDVYRQIEQTIVEHIKSMREPPPQQQPG